MANYYIRTAGGAANALATYSNDDTLKATGAAATVLPTVADDIFVESNSGSWTMNSTGTASFKSITFDDAYVGTWSVNTALAIAGSLRLGSSMTLGGTSLINLTGTGTHTIRSGGKVLGRSLTINTAGGTYTLLDDLNLGTGTLTHTQGAVNSGDFTITAGIFSSASGVTRTFNYGTSVFNLGTSNATVWNVNAGNATGDYSGVTVNFTGVGQTMVSGGVRVGTINATGAGSFTVATNNTFVTNFNRTVDFNGASLVLGNGLNIFGSLTIVGSAQNYIRVTSSAFLTQRVIQANTANIPTNINFASFEDISFTWSAAGMSWAPNSATDTIIGNAGGNNFSVAPFVPNPGKTLYLRNGGTWYSTAAWADVETGAITGGRVPLPQDDVVMSELGLGTTGGGTADVTISGGNPFICRNLTITHPVRKLNLGGAGVARFIFGNLTIAATAAGLLGTSTNQFQLRSRGTSEERIIDVPGDNFWHNDFATQDGTATGRIRLADGTRFNSPITHATGVLTFSANVWVQKIISAGAGTRTLDFRGAYVRVTGSGTNVFSLSSGSNRTVLANTSTVVEFTDTSMSPKGISLNSGNAPMTGATFKYTVDAPGSTLIIGYLPKLIMHGPGKVLRASGTGGLVWQASGGFDIQGTPQSPIKIESDIPGTQRAMSGGATAFLRYVSISDFSSTNADTVVYDSINGGNIGANITFSDGPPTWTSDPLDYYAGKRPYYAVIQEDLPSWYVAANDGNLVQLNERGPNDRIVTVEDGELHYTDPLIINGKALSFTGNDSYTIPYVVGDRSTDHTYEFWIKASPGATGDIVNRDVSAADKLERIVLTGNLTVYHQLSDGSSPVIASTKVVADNQPHHVAIISRGLTSGTIAIYIDGVLDSTHNFASTFSPSTTNPFRLGGFRASTTSYLTAVVDEVAFYRFALTDEQVTKHYTAGLNAIVATGYVKVNVGGSWVQKPAKVYLNGSWVQKPVKRYDGSVWIALD